MEECSVHGYFRAHVKFYTPVSMTQTQSTDSTRSWEDVEPQELVLTAGGEAHGVATLEDSLVFSDKTKTFQSYHPIIALLGINPKELKSVCPHKTLHIDVYYSFIHNHPNLEATKIPFSR